MASLAPAEYIVQFDSGNIPTTLTTWNLTSPNATVWTATITTAGIVTWTSGGLAIATSMVFIGLNGNAWIPSISNGGIVTVTESTVLTSSHTIATLTDSDGIEWAWYVDDDNLVNITTMAILPSLLRYPAFSMTYVPSISSDVWKLHSIRTDLTIRRRSG